MKRKFVLAEEGRFIGNVGEEYEPVDEVEEIVFQAANVIELKDDGN